MITITTNLITSRWHKDYVRLLETVKAAGHPIPDTDFRIKHNRIIRDLQEAGAWAKAELFYNFAAAANTQYNLYNWKNPTAYKITDVNGCVFTPNKGYKSDGATSYLNTNYPINTRSGITRNISSICHLTDSSTATTRMVYGSRTAYSPSSSAHWAFRPLIQAGSAAIYFMGGSFDPVELPNSNIQGFYHLRRSGENATYFKELVAESVTRSNDSNPTFNSPLLLLCNNAYNVENGAGGVVPQLYFNSSHLSVYGQFTALTDQEWQDVRSIWNNYFNSL